MRSGCSVECVLRVHGVCVACVRDACVWCGVCARCGVWRGVVEEGGEGGVGVLVGWVSVCL